MNLPRDTNAPDIGWMTQIRRELHAHPELGFEEERTAARVAGLLESWGYQVERKIGKTGVVAQLRVGDSERKLGLRADMDALPIHEPPGRAHGSQVSGVMHACGHDGHMAMLLGAARQLAEDPGFEGTLNLIFQPAEEGLGGAKAMLDAGLFSKYPCDAIFGLHNLPSVPEGTFLFRDGCAMASSDYATIVVRGKGGHGASPQRAADPVVAACSIVMALQTIVSRNVSPLESAVITVGAIHGGIANNVIPEEVKLEVSVRAMAPEVRLLLKERLVRVVEAQAESFGVRAEVHYREGYPVLVNDERETAFARTVARRLVPSARIIEQGPPLTASDDFAYFLEQCPGCYLFLGTGKAGGSLPVHNAGYDFNDDVLGDGASYWVDLVRTYLAPMEP